MNRSERRCRTPRHVLAVLAVGLLVVACAGVASGPVSSSQPSQTSAAPPSVAPTSYPSASPSAAAVSSSGPSWTYVAFGDSWPYGAHCNGCTPFPVLYAKGLAATTGRRIDFVNS